MKSSGPQRKPEAGAGEGGFHLKWHSFVIPGIFFVAIGIGLVNLWGLGPLSIGSMVSGLFLLLAGVLHADAEGGRPGQDDGSPTGDAGADQ